MSFHLSEAVDARRKRKFGKLELAMWDFVKATPRNTVVVVRTKEKVFNTSTLNKALSAIQRRHPYLHSVLMSLPFMGPYFALSGTPIYVRELGSREVLDETPEKTFLQHETGVVDNELNAKFQSPYTDFLDRVMETKVQQMVDEKREASGEIEPGTGVTKQQLMQQVPQLPLMRATLVNGPAGLGQSLIIALPQIVADGVSSANLMKEILEEVAIQEASAITSDTPEDPKYLFCMNSMDSFYPRSVGGIGATFKNFFSNLSWIRYYMKFRAADREKFHAWIPNESRVIRSLSTEVDHSVVARLKELAKERQLSLSHAFAAATVAATHEIFFAYTASAIIPTQIWVDLRPHFDAPIEPKHLGLLAGRIEGRIESHEGDDFWSLAKQAQTFDSQMPADAFRSSKRFYKLCFVDRKILARGTPNAKPTAPLFDTAPATLTNMGNLELPSAVVDHFGIDSASTYFGQAENTRFTTFTSLPNGKLSITVTYPDLIFKRADMDEYIHAVAHHITETSQGI